jgi:hypothetical protein
MTGQVAELAFFLRPPDLLFDHTVKIHPYLDAGRHPLNLKQEKIITKGSVLSMTHQGTV